MVLDIKSDKVFVHYANHIKKEAALQRIEETSKKLFAPIFDALSISEVEYTIHDEIESKQEQKLIPCSEQIKTISA